MNESGEYLLFNINREIKCSRYEVRNSMRQIKRFIYKEKRKSMIQFFPYIPPKILLFYLTTVAYMKPNRRIDILLWQYRECLSFLRNFDSLVWQTPSITMAINTFLGIIYLGYAKTFGTRILVLIASLAFTFVATVALQKHRFFAVAKSDEFRWIQNELLKEFQNVRELKLRTEEIYCDRKNYPNVPRNFMTQRGAYRWLLSTMYGTMFFMIGLIIMEVILLINQRFANQFLEKSPDGYHLV